MSDTPHYALSQDYELMFALLENGTLLGFVDYEHGSTLRDPVQIKRVADGKYFEYRAGVRGFGYINASSKDAKEKFVEQCRKYNLSFIAPNADAEARAEKAAKYAGECAAKALDKSAQLNAMRETMNATESRASGTKIRAEKAEAENARLTQERDWLATQLACIQSAYDIDQKTRDWSTARWKEAARRAVSAGEG